MPKSLPRQIAIAPIRGSGLLRTHGHAHEFVTSRESRSALESVFMPNGEPDQRRIG
jgi:hypothetical protein